MVLEDSVVFKYGDCIVTESDIRAFGYIMHIDIEKNREKIIKIVQSVVKRYYCLKENYPFEGDFKREFPFLFYQFNLFYGNRFLPDQSLVKHKLDFELIKKNVFELLFVLKYSFLLEKENDCMKLPVYFEK